jgi:hypothetical protein
MVRVYADLLTLSRAGMKTKVCGGDAHALARFFAGFNQSNKLYEFADAGASSDSVYAKIRATFNMSADNPQCRHIFLGSTTKPELIDELHQRHRHPITLLQSHSFHHDFNDLGLPVERIPNVFRCVPFGMEETDTSPAPRSESSFAKAHRSVSSTATVVTTTESGPDAKPCRFFLKGCCEYGDTCELSHESAPSSSDTSRNIKNSSLDSDWRSHRSSAITAAANGPADFALELPHDDHMPPDQVPVNAENHRLDSYILPPSSEDRQAFAARIAKRKLCYQIHLSGDCPEKNCVYDHWSISDGMRACLKETARMTPCSRRGRCRLATCFFGHICQNANCRKSGKRPWCKLPMIAHNTSIELDRWEAAVPRDGSHLQKPGGGGSAASPAAFETIGILRAMETRSASNASPSLIDDSDMVENNDQDGPSDSADSPIWGAVSFPPVFDETTLAEKNRLEAALLKQEEDAAAAQKQSSQQVSSPEQKHDEEVNTIAIYGEPVSLMEW